HRREAGWRKVGGRPLRLHQLHVVRDLRSQPLEAAADLTGASESGLDVREDVFASNLFDEIRSGEEAGGLSASAAKQEGAAGFAQAFGENFKGVESGGVKRGHVAQAQD